MKSGWVCRCGVDGGLPQQGCSGWPAGPDRPGKRLLQGLAAAPPCTGGFPRCLCRQVVSCILSSHLLAFEKEQENIVYSVTATLCEVRLHLHAKRPCRKFPEMQQSYQENMSTPRPSQCLCCRHGPWRHQAGDGDQRAAAAGRAAPAPGALREPCGHGACGVPHVCADH